MNGLANSPATGTPGARTSGAARGLSGLELAAGRRRNPRRPGAWLRVRARGAAAFTLIEIALCLAIIAFALVAIIGVLPTGLGVQKENREETIINFEANFLMDALRSGAQGQDELTNHVFIITNRSTPFINGNPDLPNVVVRYYTRTVHGTNGVESNQPYLTNAANIISLLTIPKYQFTGPNSFISNYVSADFRSLSGPSVDQGTNQSSLDFAFRYRVEVDLVPYGAQNLGGTNNPAAVNTNMPGIDPVSFPAYVAAANNLNLNLHEARLRFKWPILANGNAGNGRQVFRTMVGGAFLPGANNLTFIHPANFNTNTVAVP